MLEQFRTIYTEHRWVRYATCVGSIILGVFLFWTAGGFPPHMWRLLLQTLPQIPHLWMLKGPSMVLPLAALLLLSLSLFVAWGFLAALISWMALQQWQYRRERQHFEDTLQKAQELTAQDDADQQWWYEQTEPMQHVVPRRAGKLHFNGNAGVAVLEPQPPAAGGHKGPSPSSMLPPPLRETWAPDISTESPQSWAAGGHQGPSPSSAPPPPLHETYGPGAMAGGYKGSIPVPQIGFPPPLRETWVSDITTASTGPLSSKRPYALAIGTGLDPGIKRKNRPNEDRLLAIQGSLATDAQPHLFGLFVIADGMGGHANGQEASRLAVHHIRDSIIPTLLNTDEATDEYAIEMLREGIQHANLAVYQHNEQNNSDTGTTTTAVLILGTTISIANVGDSRTYLYSEDKGLTQITRDHSVVAQLVETGQIAADEVYTHPRRNEIYRCLGEKPAVKIDAFTRPLAVGSTLLLCSDGLWEMVRDQDIEEILATTLPDVSQSSQALIQAALDGGGKDNVSVIVVHIL